MMADVPPVEATERLHVGVSDETGTLEQLLKCRAGRTSISAVRFLAIDVQLCLSANVE